MPSTSRPGKRTLYVELPEELDRQLRLRCERTGAKIADEVRAAIGRHLAYPPPEPAYAPLPDANDEQGARARRKKSPRKPKMP